MRGILYQSATFWIWILIRHLLFCCIIEHICNKSIWSSCSLLQFNFTISYYSINGIEKTAIKTFHFLQMEEYLTNWVSWLIVVYTLQLHSYKFNPAIIDDLTVLLTSQLQNV